MVSVVSQRRFVGGSTLLFAAGAAVTILWCESMSQMGGMPMPGGWTMSMTWMLMPGQAWSAAATSFLGMWVAMMVTMMLPSLVPTLWRYRRTIAGTENLGRLTVLAGLAYFVVWSVVGVVVFPVGVALATLEMREPALARAVPAVVGVVVALLGALQLTAWKARRLACCREALGCRPLAAGAGVGAGVAAGVGAAAGVGDAGIAAAAHPAMGAVTAADARHAAAWQHGLRLGLQCTACCANLMAIPLVVGVMDLRAMAVTTAAITLERLVPAGQRVARAIGVVMVGVGVALIVGDGC